MKHTHTLPYFLFVLVILIAYNISFATIIHVPSQFETFQAAINNASNGDTIIVANGTYSGNGNYNIDFSGKNLLLKSENGASNTIIDCMNNGRGFYFQTSEDSTAILDGFTIQNGAAPSDYGGGISCFWSSPLIKNCVIIDNSSERGGGISCINSYSIIRNCNIKNNNSTWAGGIYLSSASVVVDNSDISYNTASYEGGIAVDWNSTLIINGCRINNNITSYGAIEIYYNSIVIMNNCYVQNNTDVGIIITNGSSLNMINSLISDNTSDGLWASSAGQINIINTSIVFNNNNGIYSQSSTFNIKNSILYGNSIKQIYLWSEPLPFIEYTNIEKRLTGGIVGATNWGNGNLDVYPDFVDTILKNYHLLPISQCNGVGTLTGSPSNDLDNNIRPIPVASNPDLGAYEINQNSASVSESLIESSIIIYPNPFSSNATLLTDKAFKDATLSIFNSAGQHVKQINNINGQTITLNRDNLPNGLYFIQLTQNNKIFTTVKLSIIDN